LSEPEPEEALEAEFEITDLDPHQKSNPTLNRGVHAHQLSFGRRLSMALGTILGVALLCWLVVSPWNGSGASHLEHASTGHGLPPSTQAGLHHVQTLVVEKVIYVLDQDGVVRALWRRQRYTYLLWQRLVAPSSHLVGVEHNVVYLAAPDGSLVALRASDGAVLSGGQKRHCHCRLIKELSPFRKRLADHLSLPMA
jgi:hypothetical protein